MRPADARERRIRRAAGARPIPPHFEFSAGAGRHRVWGTAFVSHEGLAVNLVGGDVPHIGAVAISIPHPAPATPRRQGATTSVFAVVGHREDELARPFAADLAQALGLTTVVVAGIHIDRAGPADLARVLENAGRALEGIIVRMKADSGYPDRGAGPDWWAARRDRTPARRGRKRRQA